MRKQSDMDPPQDHAVIGNSKGHAQCEVEAGGSSTELRMSAAHLRYGVLGATLKTIGPSAIDFLKERNVVACANFQSSSRRTTIKT